MLQKSKHKSSQKSKVKITSIHKRNALSKILFVIVYGYPLLQPLQ